MTHDDFSMHKLMCHKFLLFSIKRWSSHWLYVISFHLLDHQLWDVNSQLLNILHLFICNHISWIPIHKSFISPTSSRVNASKVALFPWTWQRCQRQHKNFSKTEIYCSNWCFVPFMLLWYVNKKQGTLKFQSLFWSFPWP